MRFPTRCVLFLACWALALATPAVIEDGGLGESSIRDPKLLFKFITIAPEACRSTSSTNTGICYSAADCTTLTGTAEGTCANGLGVCCIITKTCRGTSPFRETTFINPTNPAAETAALGNCQLRITPLNNNICQLRLDFEDFRLSQPDNEGDCALDFLQVLAGSSNIPRICGDNTGQHMYVDVSPQFGSALINVDTASAGSRWKIKVTQIECNSAQRAPSGCLQYFNTTQGTISSFNFDPTTSRTAGTRQLADQRYGICLGAQPGYCSVTYRQTDATPFSLGGEPQALAPGLVLPGSAGDTDCTTDYLLIPGAMLDNPDDVDPRRTSADRFCGLAFPTVTTTVTPFNLFFVTDGGEVAVPDSDNQGFRITYRMNPC